MSDDIYSVKDHSYEIVPDEKSFNELSIVVKEFLKKDLKAKALVSEMIQTEKTFDNSLGYIFEYLTDRQVCLNCKGDVNSCPKRIKGYIQSIYYEENNDVIMTKASKCSYLDSLDSNLANIYPCDCSYSQLYSDFSNLYKTLRAGDNIKKMKDTAAAFISVKKLLEVINDKSESVFKAYYSTSSASFSKAVIRMIAFLLAKNGVSVSYIEGKEFFTNLFSFRNDIAQATFNDYKRIKNAPVLIIEGIDEIPYLSNDNIKSFIKPLLKERQKLGKITIASLSKEKGLSYIIKGKDIIDKDILNARIENDFTRVIIKDLDLR